MHESPSAGPYPPENVWRFPLPPVPVYWLVTAIIAGVVGLAGLGTATIFLALNNDRDIPGFIDDQRVIDVAERECRLMTSTIETLRVDGSPQQRLDALTDQDVAVRRMVGRIRLLNPDVRKADRPVDAWLADWEAIVTGREDYLGKLRQGVDATFRVPRTSDGDPITKRMNAAAVDVCTVPKTLVHPDRAGGRPV